MKVEAFPWRYIHLYGTFYKRLKMNLFYMLLEMLQVQYFSEKHTSVDYPNYEKSYPVQYLQKDFWAKESTYV